MSNSLTKYEQYTVIVLNFDLTYYERTFNDESSMQSFIDELKKDDKLIDRIFVSVTISSKSLVEVV